MTEKERAVAELQGYLRNISRYDSDISPLIPDGIFADETEKAVRSFERKYTNREESGTVDYELWKKITEENEKAVFEFSRPKAISPIENADLPLRYGDRREAVYHLTALLLSVSRVYPNLPAVTVSDYFDGDTVEAVKQWQRAVGLPDNGIVDKRTWNLLADFFNQKNTVTPL